jgi:hypothetical protein
MLARFGFVLGILLVTAGTAAAQVSSASITGTVQDAAQLPMPGVTLTVRNLETGATRTVVTDPDGRYRAASIQVGRYEVRAELAGFEAAVKSGIEVTVGQEAVVNFQLKVGEVQETVTVMAEVPVVNTTTAQTSGLVTEREVKDLPLNGRSFDSLITLNPGTVDYTPLVGQGGLNNSGNKFAVAGRRRIDNLILMNGVEYTSTSLLGVTPGGVSGQLLGIDAVREFNVLKDTYSAEYGKRMGGQVNVVTMSGTNQFHGTVFEFHRNSAFDARNFFDQGDVPPFERNNFGVAAGGPIRKSRAFIFGNYEGFRQRLGLSNVSIVPDENARQGRLPVPGNPGQFNNVGISPAIVPYLVLYPLPNGPSFGDGTARFFSNPNQVIHEDFFTGRYDHNFSDRDTLNVIYTLDDGDSLTPSGTLTTATNFHTRAQVLSVESTHIFSPTLINIARFGYSRAYFTFDNSPTIDLDPSLSFIEGRPIGNFVVTGMTSVGSITTGVHATRSLYTYEDKIQKTLGSHFLKTGVWFVNVQSDELTSPLMRGQASFPNLTQFLAGRASTLQVVPNPTEALNRQLEGAWYVEDEMKLRSNLTLNLGLRHEFTNGWNNKNGCANFVPGPDGAYLTQPVVSESCLQENKAKWLFGPRVSVAWDPTGRATTAVHAGFGIHYGMLDDLGFFVGNNTPFNTRYSLSNVVLPFRITPTSTLPASTIAPQGLQPDLATPTTVAWTLRIERQVGARMGASLAYVGSHGYHAIANADYNIVRSTTLPDGRKFFATGTPRMNPQLGDGRIAVSLSNSWYHALELDLTRRLGQGVSFRGNYTFSKSTDISSSWITADAGSGGTQNLMDPYDPGRDWGLSAFDVTHRFSFNASYELPFGEGKAFLSTPGAAQAMLGDWQVNTIITIQSGFPFTPLLGFNQSRNGDSRFPDRPDLKEGASYDDVILGTPERWFDASIFALPQAGTYGNVGRNVLRGPGLATVALSLFKDIDIWDRVGLQFRAEAFNLLNRANFATPSNVVLNTDGSVRASAGLITRTSTTSRQIQFGLKAIW